MSLTRGVCVQVWEEQLKAKEDEIKAKKEKRERDEKEREQAAFVITQAHQPDEDKNLGGDERKKLLKFYCDGAGYSKYNTKQKQLEAIAALRLSHAAPTDRTEAPVPAPAPAPALALAAAAAPAPDDDTRPPAPAPAPAGEEMVQFRVSAAEMAMLVAARQQPQEQGS